MATAYLCILLAALLPYLWVAISKASGKRYDNRDPRGWLAKQENPRVHRANSAQLNAFEAFAPFAASVLMAQFAGVGTHLISYLSVAFVIARLFHGVLYIGNRALFRSLVWTAGFACVFALMAMAIYNIAA